MTRSPARGAFVRFPAKSQGMPFGQLTRRQSIMHENPSNTTEGLVSFYKFLASTGVSPVTGWRFRKRGWLTTINIAGRHYIERAEIARFTQRARTGEFAKTIRTPRRKEGAQ